MLKINLLYPLAASSLLFFSACFSYIPDDDVGGTPVNSDEYLKSSGETAKEAKTLEGQLIDSAINGAKYETDSGKTGYTDEKGTFSYKETDKTITFKVGSLVIANDFTLSKLNNDGKILPSDIAGVDRNNITDEKVVKLLRVLQSLDNDNNASNGIFIDDNTKGYLSEDINIIDADISTLQTIVKNAQKTFISQRQSREHYEKTLKSMSISPKIMPFITVWETKSDSKDITIPIYSKYDYNYTVNWGDGSITNNINNSITHTYSSLGIHTVKISGKFPAIRIVSNVDAEKATDIEKANAKKLQNITQWGNIKWSSFQNAFAWCINLDINATDIPDLSDTSSTSHMFLKAYSLKGNEYFSEWDVSNVTDMSAMFYCAETFNQELNDWNVSSVTNMKHMFGLTNAFNQPLNDWDVSRVTNMHFMFVLAKSFNQPLNKWNVSNVTDMDWMFMRASSFANQDLSSWDVSKISSVKHDAFTSNTGGGNIEPKWKESAVPSYF
jgi:surface protein